MDTGVYLIENLANGRIYVGSAVSIKKRFREHRRQLEAGVHHSRFLQRAWKKYGPLFFKFRPVVYCHRSNLLFYEQRFIDGLSPDYNSSPTAGSQLGYKHSEETRAKLRAARARNGFSPMKGRKHSKESLAKISLSRTGKGGGLKTPERLKKIAEAMRATKSSLDEGKVRKIRALRLTGMRAKEIASEVGCTHHAVYDVLRCRCYGWVK